MVNRQGVLCVLYRMCGERSLICNTHCGVTTVMVQPLRKLIPAKKYKGSAKLVRATSNRVVNKQSLTVRSCTFWRIQRPRFYSLMPRTIYGNERKGSSGPLLQQGPRDRSAELVSDKKRVLRYILWSETI